MFLRFLRRPRAEPLHVSMVGVRMGERLLQMGCDDPELLAGLAAKVGLSGTAAVIVTDDGERKRAELAGADAGALLDVHAASLVATPLDADSFDTVVIDDTLGRFAARQPGERLDAVREARRVLRPGGRIEIVEGLSGGRWRGAIARPAGYAGDALLLEAGFRPVRLLADGDRYRFYEGLKPAS